MAQQRNKHINFTVDTASFARTLTRISQRTERDLDTEVLTSTAELKAGVQKGWPRLTGTSVGAWEGPLRFGRLHWGIRNSVVYAHVIEFGGYPGVGPKTIQFAGEILADGIVVNEGIYPRQKPAAPVRRNLAQVGPQFRQNIRAIVRRNWRR